MFPQNTASQSFLIFPGVRGTKNPILALRSRLPPQQGCQDVHTTLPGKGSLVPPGTVWYEAQLPPGELAGPGDFLCCNLESTDPGSQRSALEEEAELGWGTMQNPAAILSHLRMSIPLLPPIWASLTGLCLSAALDSCLSVFSYRCPSGSGPWDRDPLPTAAQHS